MQIRCEITVKGKVQRVGYRDFIKDAAKELRLVGIVENVDCYDEDVHVACEGEEAAITKFLELLKSPELPAVVAKVDFAISPARGDLAGFKIVRGEPGAEMAERLDAAIKFMSTMNRKLDHNTEILADFRDQTRYSFHEISSKYGEVSQVLRRIAKAVGAESD